MERDAFHVSYLSDKIPKTVFHGQAVKTVAYLTVSTAQQDLRSQRLAILEIDRLATAANLIEAGTMRAIWHDGNLRKQYIPGVEAGHLGPILLDFLKGALLIHAQDRSRFRYHEGVDEAPLAEVDRFENTLPSAS